jgi:hypothetical protein
MRPHVQRKRINKRRAKRKQKVVKDTPLELWGTLRSKPERRLQEMDKKYGVGKGPPSSRAMWMDRLSKIGF